ncbi:MAG: ABC transporter ATP-binding protein [Clostridia bacterium]|nr:ABC transporter ATP-binding protein [Clostridia bacterium]
MKLMYDMPQADKQAYDAAVTPDEKLMYCIPFNILEDRFVSGWMAFTTQKIYKILDGSILAVWNIHQMSDFKTEVMYGSCGFYADIDGHTLLLCQFVSGRNLPRYTVICKACEILNETNDTTPVEDSTPERFCPKCNRPYISNSTVCPNCLDKKDTYKKLFAMTKGLRLMMCIPFIVYLFATLFQTINPILQKHAIDNYMLKAGTGEHINKVGFLLVVCTIILIDFCHRSLAVIQSRASAVAGHKFILIMRTVLYEKIVSLSQSSLQRKPIGDVMQRVTTDIAAIQTFIVGQIPQLFGSAATLIISVIIVLFVKPVAVFFIVIPIPLFLYLMRLVWKLLWRRNHRQWLVCTQLSYFLQDVLNGIRVVKSYGQEENTIEKHEKTLWRASDQVESNLKFTNTVMPLLSFLLQLGNYLVMFYGYTLLFNQDGMTMGELAQITTYTSLIYSPLTAFLALPDTLTQFLTRTSKIFEILEEENEIADIDLPIDIRIEGNIHVKNITFGYDAYNPVLKDINVDIKAGEMIGIVGHSGCGKSTLINLIMRLYDVNRGEIIIDDVNIKHISQNALRSQMGVVLQETLLFSGTIRDNICYAMPTATDEEVIAAAKIANAHDFILKLPEGYNTIVGEKGYSLSGGERQRIAIARAIIHNPRILILDEATAALDTETEKLIQDALNRISEGRTTLAIAHRLSTLRNADKLLVIDKGRVAEFGTHAELLAQKGIYYKLVMAQRRMATSLNKKKDTEPSKEQSNKVSDPLPSKA